MRYTDSKERSSEILRLALPLMARQEAAFHPWSYALWYEHLTGMNQSLSSALETHLAANPSLKEDDVWRLYAQHIAPRELRTVEKLQDRLRHLLEDTARSAVGTHSEMERFGQVLATGHQQLAATSDTDTVRRIAADLADDTQRIRLVTVELSSQLERNQREMEELTKRLEEAENQAQQDALTGLKNRRGFERAVAELERAAHAPNKTALLVIDIDHFKSVNDTYGHLRGDEAIRAVAGILQANIKGRDIAARLGGEEFVVFLPDTSPAGASTLAEQLRRAVAKTRLFSVEGRSDSGWVTVSVGIAIATEGETLVELIERADSALYAAKRAGRNRVSMA